MASGKVAPHENSEVRLVLGGLKPLATVEKSKDESNYSLAISLIGTGNLVGHVSPTIDSPEGEVVFVKPRNRHLLEEYRELSLNGVRLYGIKHYHRKMGLLFGYSLDDIEAFIKADIHCSCSKCSG